MKIRLAIAMLGIILYLCCCDNKQGNGQPQKILTHDETLKTSSNEIKDARYPNAEFREKVLSKLSPGKNNTRLVTLISLLDKSGLSYCQFIKHLFYIEDSCYAAAKIQYPNPTMQSQFARYKNKILGIAQPEYLKNAGLDENWAEFATDEYASNDTIKNFCGGY